MSKYDPLRTFLLSSQTEEVALGFEEIERLLGAPLPASQRHPAWWSNNPSNNPMTRVWLEAGYRTERVNVERKRVVFRRAGKGGRDGVSASQTLIERLQAALGGTARLAPGVDLAEPTHEAWDAERQ